MIFKGNYYFLRVPVRSVFRFWSFAVVSIKLRYVDLTWPTL